MLINGNEWYHYFWFEASCNHQLVVEGDSIINDISYKRIVNNGDECNYPYESFYREDVANKQVFYHYYDTTEILIYDYSLLPGDTIESTYQYYQFSLVLDSISTVIPQHSSSIFVPELMLDHPRIFYLSSTGGSSRSAIWIEGIGNIADPFHPNTPWTAGALGDALLCHFDNTGFRDYHDIYEEESAPCLGPIVSIDEISHQDRSFLVNVFPNPSTEFITIETDIELKDISVLDISGKLLKRYPANKLDEIDMTNFSSGVLFFVFQTVDNKYEIKKIVKK